MEFNLSKESKYKIKIVASATFISTILFFTGFQLLSGNFHGNGVPPQVPNEKASPVVQTQIETERTPETPILPEEQKIETNPEAIESPVAEEAIGIDKNSKFRASTWFSDYSAMIKNIKNYHEVHPFIYTMKGGLSNNGELISVWSKTSRKERTEDTRKLKTKV